MCKVPIHIITDQKATIILTLRVLKYPNVPIKLLVPKFGVVFLRLIYQMFLLLVLFLEF